MDSDLVSGVPDKVENADGSRDFEGIVTAKEVAATGVRDRLQEMQLVYVEGDKAVRANIIKVIKLAHDGIEAGRENVKLSERNTSVQTKLVETGAVRCTSRGQIEARKSQVTTIKRESFYAGVAFQKFARKTSQTETDL